MRRILIAPFLLTLLVLLSFNTGYAQCNGDVALCDRRYDQVVYVTTHNGFNYSPAFQLPNQSYSVAQQMTDGVRAFMLDVYDVLGTPTLYHGTVLLGTEPLEDVLIDIKDFLVANPNEVLTIIFEANISVGAMETVFASAGLNSYLYTQTFGQPWPTLQEMIDLDQRLVVLSDVDDAGVGQEWYHYMWDYCVETDYSNSSRADFSCDFNRGDSINSLFILNHFITNSVTGTGELDSSIVANSNPYFLNRVNQCAVEKGKSPNFLTVDFYDVGDVFAAKDSLNANYVSVEHIEKQIESLSIFPNPATHSMKISINALDKEDLQIRILDLSGRTRVRISEPDMTKGVFEFSTDEIGKGMFFVELKRGRDLLSAQKIILQ